MSRLGNDIELNNAVQLGNAAELGDATSLNESLLRNLIGRYGVPGLIFDNSPASVFSDSAGTTPAGVGDVVGLVKDLSGGDHHLEQATTAAKPILRAGPLLEFDGTDDYLINTSPPFTGDELTVIVCVKWLSDPAAFESIFTLRDNINGELFLLSQDTGRVYLGTSGAGGGNYGSPGIVPTRTDKNIYSIRINPSVGEISVNGVRSSGSTVTSADLSLLTELRIAMRTSNSGFADIDNHFVFAINKSLTDTELENAEQYIANLCGVTL